MKRSDQHPVEVSNLVDGVLRRMDPKGRLAPYRLWTFWNELVGEALAARAQPLRVQAGVLSVGVAGAAWMQELQYSKEPLRQRINARLGAELIRDIRFVPAPDNSPKRRAAAMKQLPVVSEEPVEATPVALPEGIDAPLADVFRRLAAARARSRRDR